MTLTNSFSIPTDVIHDIVDAIEDREALKQCALVAKSFLIPSRKRLFTDIYVRCSAQSERLYSVLVHNPDIQGYIKKLYIINEVAVRSESLSVGLRCRCSGNVQKDWTLVDGTLVPIFQLAFPRLESFSMLTGNIILSWKCFPPPLQAALRNIMNISSLTSVKLAFITNAPIDLFPSHLHVRLLQFTENFFSVPEKDHRSQDTSQLIVLNTSPPIHVEHLRWKATFNNFILYPPSDNPMYLPMMSHLRFVEFDALLFPGSRSDALSCMLHALNAALVSPDTLEHFMLRLSVALDIIDIETLAGYSGWTVLDSTFTRTTPGLCFSCLRKVDIIIYATPPPPHQNFDDSTRARVAGCMPSLHKKGILSVNIAMVNGSWVQTFLDDS